MTIGEPQVGFLIGIWVLTGTPAQRPHSALQTGDDLDGIQQGALVAPDEAEMQLAVGGRRLLEDLHVRHVRPARVGDHIKLAHVPAVGRRQDLRPIGGDVEITNSDL